MTEVRAITPSCSGLSRASCEIVSSVRPSARYSLLGSPVRFSNGSTASMIFCDLGGFIPPKCRQYPKHTTTKRTADAPRTQLSARALALLEPPHLRDSGAPVAYRLANFRRSSLEPQLVLRCLPLRQR